MQQLFVGAPRITRSAPGLAPFLLICALFYATAALAADGLAQIDDEGHLVRLQAPARRIVTLAPHATELIYEVGAGDALAAVSQASDFPAEARKLPSVGGANGLDLERIVALKPDLVVAWTSGNSKGEIEALERFGLTVFQSDPKTVEQIASTLERLGRLSGHETQGLEKARALRQGMAQLASQAAGKASVPVFYDLWDDPLYTVGGTHLVTQLIAVCGGRNIFSDLNVAAPEVSPEAVLARDPWVIITSPKRVAKVTALWKERGKMSAITTGQIEGIDPDWLLRATSRVLLGTKALCDDLQAARSSREHP